MTGVCVAAEEKFYLSHVPLVCYLLLGVEPTNQRANWGRRLARKRKSTSLRWPHRWAQ